VKNDSNDPNAAALSRFSERSKWLLAELVIIIVGVLIALAIDEWRGKIEDANLEREYLTQLIIDLRVTEEKMASDETRNAVSETAIVQFVAAFEDSELVELDLARQWLYEIRTYNNSVPVLGTVEALVSTGDLRLIRNPSTRSKITQYLSQSRDFWLVPLYQLEERHRILGFQIIALAEMHGISPRHRSGLLRDTSEQDAEADTAEFFAQPQAYSLVVELARIKNIMSDFRKSMSAEATELRESLELFPFSE